MANVVVRDIVRSDTIKQLNGHKEWVTFAKWSNNGRYILSGGADQKGIVWDASTAKEIVVFEEHGGIVRDGSLSADDQRVVTGSNDGTVRLWDRVTGKTISIFSSHQGGVVKVVFNQDGSKIVSLDEKGVLRVWNAGTAKLLFETSKSTASITDVAFIDRNTLAALNREIGFDVLDASSGKNIRSIATRHTLPEAAINHAQFYPSRSRALLAYKDGVVQMWDLQKGHKIWEINAHDTVSAAEPIGEDRVLIVYGTSSWVAVVDVRNESYFSVLLDAHDIGTATAAISPDLTRAVTSDWNGFSHVWTLDWLYRIQGRQLLDETCSCHVGVTGGFTDVELKDSILAGLNPDNLVARNPCLRRGPLHWEYYTQAFTRWTKWAAERLERFAPQPVK